MLVFIWHATYYGKLLLLDPLSQAAPRGGKSSFKVKLDNKAGGSLLAFGQNGLLGECTIYCTLRMYLKPFVLSPNGTDIQSWN